MMLDPRRLLSFAVFARHLSFTHAAKALHLTQPALHMQVRQLEGEAGAALYRRAGARLELTRAGQRLALLGLRLEEQLAQAEEDLRGEPASLPVTLSAGEGALLHLRPRGIRAWQALGLGPLRILTQDREAAFKAVLEGAAHLAVTSVESLPEAPLRWLRLAEVAQCLAVPRAHRLAGRRSVRLAEIAGEALILPPTGSPLRTAVDAVAAAIAHEGSHDHITSESSGDHRV